MRGVFDEIDQLRGKIYGEYYLDLHIVAAAHAWLEPQESPEASELLVEFVRSAIAFVTPLADGRYPGDLERWVLELAGRAVTRIASSELRRELSEPMWDLSREAGSWTTVFLEAGTRHGLQCEGNAGHFWAARRQVIEHAFEQGWDSNCDCWTALIGIDPVSLHLWDAPHGKALDPLCANVT